jgi:leader peptidase (prepilin peptidase) / N-methyltransferase
VLTPLLAGMLGAILGPLLHHVAVATGDDLPLALSEARCRECTVRLEGLTSSCTNCDLSNRRTWIVTALTAVVFGAVAWAVGPVWVLPAFLGLTAMTVVLLVTDIDHKRIPNRVTYPGTPAVVALLVAGAFADGDLGRVPVALAGGLAYSGILLIVFLVARGGFGFGDVKLAVPLGVVLVYLGWSELLVAGFTTAILGGVLAVAALVMGRAGAKSEIPYGPPMIVGAWITIVAGPALTDLIL